MSPHIDSKAPSSAPAAALEERERRALELAPSALYIGGEWRPASGGAKLAVEDPATGQTIAEVPDATTQDALAALAAAADAQPRWEASAPRERGEILRRAYELLSERAEELALLMTLEMGKPVAESRAEIAYAAEFLRWFSEEAVRVHGRYMPNTTGSGRILTMRQPVGPCVFVTPWNFPTAMGTRKIAPAVAAGCTMVVKPAQQTPLSMLALAGLLEEAGLPGGVLNVITAHHSGEVIEPLLKDSRTRKLSFTGSTEVGRKLIAQSADQILRVSMELGGNAPFLVFEDADLEAAVEGALTAKLRNVGEACTAANRFHVHESLADEFARRMAERMSVLKLGRGTEEGVQVGPLIDDRQRGIVAELVGDALERGGRLLTGGEPVSSPAYGGEDGGNDDGSGGKGDGSGGNREGGGGADGGRGGNDSGRSASGGSGGGHSGSGGGHGGYFYAPTVIADVPAGARALREEIFGPVAPIAKFADEREAITAANATEYGLVAYVYTRDLQRALRVCEALEVGMVGLNQGMVSNPAAPFGGVKQSGFGREGGFEGIDEYLETKYVAVAL